MKHEYVDASDLIQTDMRSGNEKKLDAMLDERGANEMGAETAVVLRNIALELMAQLEQDEKTRPASDADMAVYHEISSNYNKDRSALAAQIHPRTSGGEMKPTQQEIIELARELRRIANPNESRIYQHERGKLFEAARMLERFSAGGGEPMAFVHWPLSGAPRLAWYGYKALNAAILKAYEGHQPDMLLYTHPSPTDLRAEYLRGLEDAAKVADANATDARTRHAKFRCVNIAEAIRALKGKQ